MSITVVIRACCRSPGYRLVLTAAAEVAVAPNSNNVSHINTDTYREIKRAPIGKGPHHLIAAPDDRFLVIANTFSDDLVFLDRATARWRGGSRTRPIRISSRSAPDERWFVVVANRLDRVDVYRYDAHRR